MALNEPITEWKGKRVWLVGASSGIGRALASLLYAQGAHVIVSARRQTQLHSFTREHPGSRSLPLDVRDAPAVSAAAKFLTEDSALDLVCYCAGHYRPMRADSLDLAELKQHHDINVVGALNLSAAVVPLMLQDSRRGGSPHLSFVASVAGWRGLPQSLAYGPTKAALINFAETLFVDLRPHGVNVSVINPGFVDTALTRQNTFTMPARLTPEQAAETIVRGWRRGAFELHFPRRFTVWLKLLRVLPYRWYFPLVHRFTGL